jgi:hypothetical protein
MRGDRKREKRVRAALDPWVTYLGLEHTHHLTVNLCDACECEEHGGTLSGNDAFASTSTNYPYTDVSINITRKGVDEATDEELERAVLHELLHVVVSPMGVFGGFKVIANIQAMTEDEGDIPETAIVGLLSAQEEHVVDILTRVCIRLKGKGW